MFTGLKRFLLEPTPTQGHTAASLRTLFALAFLGQFAVVGVAGLGLALVASPVPASSPLLAQVLLVVALLELPVALIVAEVAARPGGKEGAMAGAIALGVVLATPVWFGLFAWLSGAAALYLTLFAGLIMVFYTLGFILVARYARRLEQAGAQGGSASLKADAPDPATEPTAEGSSVNAETASDPTNDTR